MLLYWMLSLYNYFAIVGSAFFVQHLLFSHCTCIWSLRLVIRSKCCFLINREKMQIAGTMSLSTFLIISLINLTFAWHVFSNILFYCWRYLSLSAMLCSQHTLSFCRFAVLLSSPHLPFDIKNRKHFHVIIDRNKLFRFTSLFHLEVAHSTCHDKSSK